MVFPLKKAMSSTCWTAINCVLLAASCALASSCIADNQLPPELQASLRAQGIKQQEIGVVVMAERDGHVRLSHLARRAMSPASTLKTLTTIAALDTLGPAFHWKTAFLTEQSPADGVLNGALYLRGGAEPNLSWEKLGVMLREIYAQGIHHINGDLIIDRRFFNPTRIDLNVAPFDSTPTQYYNVIPDAMLVSANLIDLQLSSDHDKVAVQFLPPLDGVQIQSQLQLVDENCAEWDEEWPVPTVVMEAGNPTVILNGTFPRGCRNQTSTNILDRNLYIERLIRRLWREIGGQWNGVVRDGATPAQAQIVSEHVSESLAEIVRIINKRSDNTMARDLYLTLGAQAKTKDSELTLNLAQQSVRQWLHQQHIDDTGLVLENGSGLSRIERISPLQLAQVLRAAAASNWSAEFKSSLPIFGVDGTMAKSHSNIELGAARIKGGTLNNTSAIAGYVRDKDGENWIVVGIINRPDAAAGRLVLHDLIDWVATSSKQTSNTVKTKPVIH